MAAKLTPEQQEIDNMIRSINRQLVTAAKTFGKDHHLYQRYEAIISGYAHENAPKRSFTSLAEGQLIRWNKEGILQLSRSKADISQYDITAYKRVLKQLSKQQKTKTVKKHILEAYTKMTGKTPKTEAEKQAAIAEQLEMEKTAQNAFGQVRDRVYEIIEQTGIRFQAVEEVKGISRGSFTSYQDLAKMTEIYQKVLDGEDKRIIENGLPPGV